LVIASRFINPYWRSRNCRKEWCRNAI